MKNRLSIPVLLVVLAVAGCQGNPRVRREIDAYGAENRALEDVVYAQEQDIQVLLQKIARLERHATGGGSSAPSGSGTRRATPPRRDEDLNPPGVETPSGDTPGELPRPLNRPALPTEPDIGPVLDPPAKKPAKDATDKVKPTAHEQNVTSIASREPEVTDKKVTHIQLSPLHTSGLDFNHAPGDDGLSVLIEPRNAANQFVPVAAPVSVVVLDPSKDGEDARLARWDFSQQQIEEKIVQGDMRGIHLKLPWPAKPPANARLEVFVRYDNGEGKKLQAEKEIFVALPGQYSQRWTPRTADRQRAKPSAPKPSASNEPLIAAAPPPLVPIEPEPAKEPEVKLPPPATPPAGLSERQPGEKLARPKWGPTR